jgi:hypothetical protein
MARPRIAVQEVGTKLQSPLQAQFRVPAGE